MRNITPAEHRQAGCEGKFRFISYAIAVKAAKRNKDVSRWAYACTHCGGFHVGERLTRHADRGPLQKRARRAQETEV